MLEFIFMLTRDDQTVSNALEVYEGLRDTDLRYAGFKDVGVGPHVLQQLTSAIRADGRTVVLEVVSLSVEDEVRSVRVGLDLGVDMIMGGTHPEAVLPLLVGRPSPLPALPGHRHRSPQRPHGIDRGHRRTRAGAHEPARRPRPGPAGLPARR